MVFAWLIGLFILGAMAFISAGDHNMMATMYLFLAGALWSWFMGFGKAQREAKGGGE
jgi:hypothetical protein